MLFPTDSILDKNILCLRFLPLKMAQIVQYRGFQTNIYICKRVQITQVEPDAKPKRRIDTEVSISIDNFADNMEAFGIDFSSKLLKHFNVALPYKEFRFN